MNHLPIKQDFSSGDFIFRISCNGHRERGFSRAVFAENTVIFPDFKIKRNLIQNWFFSDLYGKIVDLEHKYQVRIKNEKLRITRNYLTFIK